MLSIEQGIGRGDRQAMETWFDRAMKANGNDREACWAKLDWLDPKWYGGDSTDEMIAFGRACRATKNWRNGLSLLVVDAHHRHYSRLDRQVQGKYLHDPKIHEEICIAFEDHLKHYPNGLPRAEQVRGPLLPGRLHRPGARPVPDPRRQPDPMADVPLQPPLDAEAIPRADRQADGGPPGREAPRQALRGPDKTGSGTLKSKVPDPFFRVCGGMSQNVGPISYSCPRIAVRLSWGRCRMGYSISSGGLRWTSRAWQT